MRGRALERANLSQDGKAGGTELSADFRAFFEFVHELYEEPVNDKGTSDQR